MLLRMVEPVQSDDARRPYIGVGCVGALLLGGLLIFAVFAQLLDSRAAIFTSYLGFGIHFLLLLGTFAAMRLRAEPKAKAWRVLGFGFLRTCIVYAITIAAWLFMIAACSGQLGR